MKFPFYHNNEKAYTIDDANYDCWRIIVADCDMWHKYATLCELVAECPDVKQLTRPCIVDFLNNINEYIPNDVDINHAFLKVGSDWCLEIANPCICDDWDRYVAATDEDNDPGPLDRKVKWSCSYDWLYCIDIEEAWPQTLVWRPSGPNWPFINPSLPTWTCEKWFNVKLVPSWWKWAVDYECPADDPKPQYARCEYLCDSWIASTPCCMYQTGTDWERYRIWRTVRYFVTRSWYPQPVDSMWDNATSYIDWKRRVQGTDAFDSPRSYWVIRIKSPWLYIVNFSAYITFNQVLKAIRCWLRMDDWSWWKEINDIKYETWEYRDQTKPTEVFNRTWPDAWDKAKFVRNSLDWNWESLQWWALWTLDNTWLPFANSYTINVQNELELAMVVKPDTRWIDPRLIKSWDYEDRYRLKVEWWDWNPYWATTSIEIAKIDNMVPAARFHDL